MRILPDDSYVFRMIEAEVDKRILDQMKSKEFCENSWKDYLNKEAERKRRRNNDSFFDYTIRVKKYKEIIAEMDEIIKKEREARYKEALEEDSSR